MTTNLATLFFTPQAGGGAGATGPVPGKGGIFAAPPGAGGLMDLLFARLLQETAAGVPADGGEGGEESVADGEGVLSLLAPPAIKTGEEKGPKNNVFLNQILHKIAHEVSATLPAAPQADDEGGDGQDISAVPAVLPFIAPSVVEGPGTAAEISEETVAAPDSDLQAPEENAAPVMDKESGLSAPKRMNFMAFLHSLLEGLPQESKPVVLNIAPGLLRKISEKLEFAPDLPAEDDSIPADTPVATPEDGANEASPAPALIATGLTPDGLTKFMEELSQRLQQGESFIVGMVKILPPQAKREMIFMPRALVLPGVGKAPDVPSLPAEAIETGAAEALDDGLPVLPVMSESPDAPQPVSVADPAPEQESPHQNHRKMQGNPLLALLAALQAEESPLLMPHAPGQAKKIDIVQTADASDSEIPDDHRADPVLPREIIARLNALVTGADDPAADDPALPQETGFARVLKVLEEAQARNADKNPSGLDKAVNVIKSMSPVLSAFQGGGAFPVMGMVFAAAMSGDIFPDGWDWSKFTGSAAGQPMTVNGPAAMAASLVNQAPNAAMPHPATQIVVATITKAAATGENRNITVKLEPPELGRVEIRMEFGKDKIMKAHIIAEKPETYMLLQRDAHVLDRTLQDAGLDADGGVSFELAQDGGAFDDGKNNQRGASGGGESGSGTEIAEETIESTMDWYVDPDTGLTRYDILA